MRLSLRPRLANRGTRSIHGLARRAKFFEQLEPRALLAAISWDGEGLDGDWHNALNWVGDVVPGPDDDVTIAPGLGHPPRINSPVTIRSLDLSLPLNVFADLSVTESTTIGDVPFLITDAAVSTANLTLVGGSASVTNFGTWTISGNSTIARTIVSDWSILLADDSRIAFVQGAGDDFGAIESTRGTVSFGARSLVDGLGADHEHIRVVDLLSLGQGAIVQEAGIVVVGGDDGPGYEARIEGLGVFGAAFINVSLDLDWARVAGVITISNSATTARNSVTWTARSHFEGGSLHVRGAMSGENLRLRSMSIVMGDDAIEGSAFLGWKNNSIERSTITLLELSYIRGTLTDTSITGNFSLNVNVLAGCVIAAGTTVIVSDAITDSPDSGFPGLNPLVGLRALDVYGRLIVAGGRVAWDGSAIRLLGPDSRLHTSITGHLVSDAGRIFGDGQIVNAGTIEAVGRTTLLDASVLNTGTLLATSNLQVRGALDSRGTVEAKGGSLVVRGDVAQIVDGVLTKGTWKASDGGRLTFLGFSIHRNNATIVADGDSILQGFSDLRRNSGTILLLGAGDWIDGTLNPINLVNDGTIRKEGRRTRNIIGDIRQTKRGVLEVLDGRLMLEGSLDSAGAVRVGSPGSANNPGGARLRITDDFNQRAAGVLSFIGATGSASKNYPRLIADQAVLRGVMQVNFDQYFGSGVPRDQWVTLIIADEPRVGTFGVVDLNIVPGTGVLKYTTDGVRVRLIP